MEVEGVILIMENLLQFFSRNKDSLLAIGVLLTFFVSIISLYFSVRNNKAVHYVNSITKSRIEWIQKIRDTVSVFISKTNVYNNAYYKGDYDKSGEHLSECQKLCTEIKLLLNYCDKRDKEICNLVDAILENHRKYCDSIHNMQVDKKGYFIEGEEEKRIKKQIEEDISELVKKLHIYLKAEWNRVKYESQGKIYEKETREFDIFELEQKYDNPGYTSNIWKRFYIDVSTKIKRVCCLPGFIIVVLVGVIVMLSFLIA